MTTRFLPCPPAGGRLAAALVAPLAAAALAVPAAAAGSTHDGRCAFRPFDDDTVTGDGYDGFLAAAVALRSDDVAANPVTATVTCHLSSEGVAQPGTDVTATGTGAVVVLGHITPPWLRWELVDVCTVVDFADATPTATECVPFEPQQIPPQVVYDTADAVLRQVWPVTDPVVCGALSALAPGPDPVVINDQGDVYVDGEPMWDCPPYDIEWE